MSLKGLELQIAIPKTVDAGKMADQMQQQSLVNQANAQAATKRQIEKNRETVIKSNLIEADSKGNSQGNSQEHAEQEKKDRNKGQENNTIKHPFKGNLVDYNG